MAKTATDKAFKVTRFIKVEDWPIGEQINGVWLYRAFFRYKGRSAYLDIFLTDEFISEMDGIPEFVNDHCLDWAKENFHLIDNKGETE